MRDVLRGLIQRLALLGFHALVARPVLRGIAAVRYRRLHLVPEGPCVVVSNHNSHLDAAVLMGLFPLRRLHRVHPAAAADYFGQSWMKRTMAMALMNGIPVIRRPVGGQDPLGPLLAALRQGHAVIFFPEGSRGEAGVVGPFRPGIGLIARALPEVPIVPVFLAGPERIWPRGNLVPVPLTIDVSVGRPRVYPGDADPRHIAEQVREEVLALAPPLPPLPDEPPAPPLRVAVCGADPAARHAVFRAVTAELGRLGRTLGLAESVLEADASGVRERSGPLAGRRSAWIGAVARLLLSAGRARRFEQLVEAARINEVLQRGHDLRFVIEDGDALIDLLATAETQLPRPALDERGQGRLLRYLTGEQRIPPRRWAALLRHAPELWLLNVFDLARPPAPRVLVLVTSGLGHEERRAGRAEELDATTGPGSDAAFIRAATVLRRKLRVEVVECSAGEDPGAVAKRVQALALRLADTGSPPAVSQA